MVVIIRVYNFWCGYFDIFSMLEKYFIVEFCISGRNSVFYIYFSYVIFSYVIKSIIFFIFLL